MQSRVYGFILLTAASCGGVEYDVDTAEAPLTTVASTGTLSGNTLASNALINPPRPLGIFEQKGLVSGIGPNGTSLGSGASSALAVVTGWALLNQTLTGKLANGANADLRVDGVALGTGRNNVVYYFDVKQRSGSTWVPLCGTSNGAIITAIAVPGQWNTKTGVKGGGEWTKPQDNNFTFVCRGSSIAKCVEMGYHSSIVDSGKKPKLLLACVRALRADYCGDGRSWTTNGRILELWDVNSINNRTMPAWTLEAGWKETGASCVATSRTQFPSGAVKPVCLASLLESNDCGSSGGWTVMSSFQ